MATVILTDTFACRNCGCINMPHDDVTQLTVPGNFEEPAEYEAICPECGSDDVKEESAFLCRGCGDVQVQDEDDYCQECLGELTAARTESMKESEWEIYDAI